MVNSQSSQAEILASSVFPLNFIINILCLGPNYPVFEYSLGFTPTSPYSSLWYIPHSSAGLLTASLCPLQNYPSFFYKSYFHKIPLWLRHFLCTEAEPPELKFPALLCQTYHSQGRSAQGPRSATFYVLAVLHTWNTSHLSCAYIKSTWLLKTRKDLLWF